MYHIQGTSLHYFSLRRTVTLEGMLKKLEFHFESGRWQEDEVSVISLHDLIVVHVGCGLVDYSLNACIL